MSKEEILESNKLIAEFMYNDSFYEAKDECYCEDKSGCIDFYIEDAKYSKSWDWLMPVVEKIVNHIDVNKVTWLTRQQIFGNLYSAISTVSLNNIYLATIEFIKWYNQNKLNESN